MAAAQMQRPPYSQPLYHTPQSAPANSIPPQAGHDYSRIYNQQPNQIAQPLQYGNYTSVGQVPSYSHHPGQSSASSHALGPQPMLLSHQQSQQPLSHHVSSNSMSASPRTKLETPLQRSMELARTQGPAASPIATSSSVSVGAHTTTAGGGTGTGAAPGPIPATTPLVVQTDNNGVQWISFEYSRDRVKMEYRIRCDVESVNIEELAADFKTDNCVYPRACVHKDHYKGNRYVYETDCNNVGWALAHLNHCLRGKRGLIQRAVDSWRNSNSDPKLRSRRVRRQAKQDKRGSSSRGGNHLTPSHLHGMLPGTSGILHGPPPLGVPMPRQPLAIGGPQLHHHHHRSHAEDTPRSGPEDGSDISPEEDLRQAQIFQGGYPSYPPQPTIPKPSLIPALHDNLTISSQPPIRQVTGTKRSHSEDSATLQELYGDIPESKRRKFVLLVDPERADPLQKKKRVRVQLDKVDLQEVPDSYRQQNAVYPRAYFPQQMLDERTSAELRYFGEMDEEGESEDACIGKTLIPIPLLDGEGLALPRISHSKRRREGVLNGMCYRMLWSNRSTFAGRTLFMQRSLDLYRQKSRETIVQHAQSLPTERGQVETESVEVPMQFRNRVGRERWKAFREGMTRGGSEDEERD